MLRFVPHREVIDDLEGVRIDDVDRVAAAVGNVHAVGIAADRRAQITRPVGGVDIVRVDERRHAWERVCRLRQRGNGSEDQNREEDEFTHDDEIVPYRESRATDVMDDC